MVAASWDGCCKGVGARVAVLGQHTACVDLVATCGGLKVQRKASKVPVQVQGLLRHQAQRSVRWDPFCSVLRLRGAKYPTDAAR